MGGLDQLGSAPDIALVFGIALAAAPVVLWGLRRIKLQDIPSPRSSHQVATPRGGGLAPALGCILGAAFSSQLSATSRDAVLLVSACMGLIGLADDLSRRSAAARLAGQLGVALVALVWLTRGLGGGILVDGAIVPGIVVGLVGYVNAFNFMDGINGLAVAQVVVAGASWWIIGRHEHLASVAAAGAISATAGAAFAPFNMPRARMFLGDVGSYFFGGWLAAAAIVGLRAGVAPEAMLAPLVLFVADPAITLLLRIRRGKPWAEPHRDHVYQRLLLAGWSHTRTTLTVGLVMGGVSALGAISLTGSPALRAIGDAGATAALIAYFRLPAVVSAQATKEVGVEPV